MAAAIAGCGLLLYLLLPSSVILLDDDFGYLKSVIQTYQHGRPWTDDFLEPWSASSSSLSALLFALTGNFYFATYGLQVCFGAASLPAVCLLLSARGFSVRATFLLAALILTFPVLLWRALEYNGMSLYVPCLLWAIWAAERRRWGVFAVVFLLAVANRQSAAGWLVLPGWAVLQAFLPRSGASFASVRAPLAVIVGGLAMIALLFAVMNSTDSQRMLFGETFSRFDLSVARRSIFSGLVVVIVAVGLAVTLQTLGQAPVARRPAWRGLALVGLVVAAFFLLRLDVRALAIVDRADTGWRGGWLYTKLIVALALAGWIGFRFRLRAAPALCALASVGLAGLRPSVWDYYFVDAALLGFFSVAPGLAGAAEPQDSSLSFIRWWRPALLAGLACVAAFHALFTLHFKTVLDEAQAISTLYERALRKGLLRHNETVDSHFGFGGWHLFSYGIAKRGTNHGRWFSALRAAPVKSVELAIDYPDSFPRRWRHETHTIPDPKLAPLAEETARIAWFWRYRYVLQRRAPPAEPSTLGPDFRPILFPLNNAEWRELAAGPPLK